MQTKKCSLAAAPAAPPEPDDDKIALVKAAAWAWHQRSSSTKTKQSIESPSATPWLRRRSSHRPSRYQLESLSKSNSTSSSDHPVSEKRAPITLLDLYEIERIRKELERLVVASERIEKIQIKKVQRRKHTERGCLFGRHAAMICGSEETAADTEALVSRPRKSSSEIQKCRPAFCKNI